ncbi:S-adenosyl methyltransferase [Frankia canadensis]|uniref:S-adenosyl methyltransferase n=1 Tax=Frankia canadensis TaxID=1836972 RepID=A0A2I2KUS3_9ACTN|nr:SAM-dependent methyltransferase [Frankia canadensis]SNQ49416.1 S-adenosyl methyltransferase [Frankia canadensis]SOU56706.1 S-adenosyl methyltransferase [Frankia canadensis]
MAELSTIDTSVPHSARVWNYWLGGKDNYPTDRAAGDQVYEIFPAIVEVARASRAFLTRAVSFLVTEAGVRHFLDVGTGLPTADNTHEVAQRLAPDSRVVYVDNDPMVLAHARALLASSPEGATAYLDADVRHPEAIIEAAARTLDLTAPVALMLLGIMGHVAEFDDAISLVRRLVDALPSGSYLVLNDGTSSPARDEALDRYSDSGADAYHSRTPEQIAAFFAGLDLVEPGVVSTPLWRPGPAATPLPLDVHCGVAKKP